MMSANIHVGDDYGFRVTGRHFPVDGTEKGFSAVNLHTDQGYAAIYYYSAESMRQHAAELLRLADEMEESENA